MIKRVPPPYSTNRIIDLYAFPQMGALGHELLMNGVNLVFVMCLLVGKYERQRKIVRMVDNGPTRFGRLTDVGG